MGSFRGFRDYVVKLIVWFILERFRPFRCKHKNIFCLIRKWQFLAAENMSCRSSSQREIRKRIKYISNDTIRRNARHKVWFSNTILIPVGHFTLFLHSTLIKLEGNNKQNSYFSCPAPVSKIIRNVLRVHFSLFALFRVSGYTCIHDGGGEQNLYHNFYW